MRVITRTHENSEEFQIDHYEVELVDETGNQIEVLSFSYSSDCPEDNNIERNFNDILNIENLIIAAYEAGKKGEDLTFSLEEVDW